jgi:hypothetical protein
MKTGFIAIIALMALLMAFSVSAAYPSVTFTWGSPAATAATMTGTAYDINLTAAEATASGGNVTKVFFEYKLSSASSWTAVNASGNMSNKTAGGVFFTSEFNTAPLYDNQVYQIRATAYNDSGVQTGQDTTLATLYVDNHAPATPTFTSTMANGHQVDFPKDILTWNANNASSCVLRVYDLNGFKALTGVLDTTTAGSETCSYKILNGDVTEGIHRVSAASSDLGSSADTTESTVYTGVNFIKTKSMASVAQIIDSEAAQAGSAPNYTKILIFGGIIVLIYYVWIKRK